MSGQPTQGWMLRGISRLRALPGVSSLRRRRRARSRLRIRALVLAGAAAVYSTLYGSAAAAEASWSGGSPAVSEKAASGQAPALALADSTLEAAVRRIASELRCPVCQGLSLQDSPTELAQEMKAVIREQLAAGRSAEEVRAYFVSKYGEWILLEPEPRGFNLLVYVLPALALVAGVAVVVASVRRWSRAAVGAEAEAGPSSGEPGRREGAGAGRDGEAVR